MNSLSIWHEAKTVEAATPTEIGPSDKADQGFILSFCCEWNGFVLFSWTESRKRLWWWCNWIRPIFDWKLHLPQAGTEVADTSAGIARSDEVGSKLCLRQFQKMECIVWRIPESCLFFPAAKTLRGEYIQAYRFQYNETEIHAAFASCRKWTRFQFDTRPKQEMLARPLRWPRVTRRIKGLYWVFCCEWNGFVLFSWTESRKRLWWWCNWIRPIFDWKLHLPQAGTEDADTSPGITSSDEVGSKLLMFASILRRWNALSGEFRKFVNFNTMRQIHAAFVFCRKWTGLQSYTRPQQEMLVHYLRWSPVTRRDQGSRMHWVRRCLQVFLVSTMRRWNALRWMGGSCNGFLCI